MQFVVDNSKKRRGDRQRRAGNRPTGEEGYSGMAQRCAVPAGGSRGASPLATGHLRTDKADPHVGASLKFTGPLPTASRQFLLRAVSVHTGEFGDACERVGRCAHERTLILLVGRRCVWTRLSTGFGALP